MNKNSLILTFSSLAFFVSVPFAHAVSVTMEQGPMGDRIRISQTEGDQNIQSLRVSPDTLFVQVDNASQMPVVTPETVDGALVNGFISHNDGVSVSLADVAFGFIQSQDANGDILIDVYPDEMGARWRQSDTARQAYERLEEQQALPSQNPNFPQYQSAQNSPIAQNTSTLPNAQTNPIRPVLENGQGAQTTQNPVLAPTTSNDPLAQTTENPSSFPDPLADSLSSDSLPLDEQVAGRQTPQNETINPSETLVSNPSERTNPLTVANEQNRANTPPISHNMIEETLSSQLAPPSQNAQNSRSASSRDNAPNTENLPSISQSSGHNSNLGSGIPFAPSQSQTSQSQASNPVSQGSQGLTAEAVAPTQNIGQIPEQASGQTTGQNLAPVSPIQNSVQNPQVNINQTTMPESGSAQNLQAQISPQTSAPAQNINITLDNQSSTQAPNQNTTQQIPTQAHAPSSQININLTQDSNTQTSQNTPVSPAPASPTRETSIRTNPQNQGAGQDININLQTQKEENSPAPILAPQILEAQESPQEINININTKTDNTGQVAQQSAPVQSAPSANTDININITQNEQTAGLVPEESIVPEEIVVPDVTSFTFSFTDQTEKEAHTIEPKEVIAQQMAEEAKHARENPELQRGASKEGTSPNVNVEASQKAEPETQKKMGTPEKIEVAQKVDEKSSLITNQDDGILNPVPDPVLDETGAPIQAEIIYLDEEGNVVPAPLNIPKTLEEMRAADKGFNYQELLRTTDLLRDKPLPKELLEEVLYNRAVALYQLNQEDLFEKGGEIIRAAADMINLNPSSAKVPSALALMVPAAIATDHIGEAKYAVDKLLAQYPQNEETPATTLLLASSYLNDNEPINASKYLDILINNYPNSPFIQEAAILQTKSIYSQGDMDRTLTFLDFLDRRFDKVYITAPEYFTIRGKIEEDAKRYDKVASNYLTLYNLDPKGEMADFALDKVANAYYHLDQKDSARKILEELVEAFPESPYRVSALMRIGENGLYDADMNLEQMFDLFNAPNPNLPHLFYNKIIAEYPNSKEAQTAQLRLAALSLWEKDYTKAADLVLPIYEEFVGKVEGDRALEILLSAVEPLLSLSISEKNYEHVLRIWEKYPPVHSAYTPYSDPLRMSLGRALLNRNQEKEGEDMLAPFIEEIPTTQAEFDDGLYAYSIILANAFKRQDWGKVLEVTEQVEDWDLPKDTGLQRLYSTALAAQNLNLPARALPIWHALAPNPDVPLYQRAYAQYFLARDAERRQNLREAYQANLDTLAMFDDLYTQRSPYANLERNRESIAALMDLTEIAGRYTESMEWLNKYRYFVPTDSPDYPGVQLREARLHKKMGDDLRWRSILEQVRDKDPESVFGKMAASELASFEMARDLNRMTTRGR